jgi:hypothetical protein
MKWEGARNVLFPPFLQIVLQIVRPWIYFSPGSPFQRTRTPKESFLSPTIYAASTLDRRLEKVSEPVTIVTADVPHRLRIVVDGLPWHHQRRTQFQRHVLRMGSPCRVLS